MICPPGSHRPDTSRRQDSDPSILTREQERLQGQAEVGPQLPWDQVICAGALEPGICMPQKGKSKGRDFSNPRKESEKLD